MSDIHQAKSQTDVDLHFLRMASNVAGETDDPKAKIDESAAVGAVLVPQHGDPLSAANRIPLRLRRVGYKVVGANSPDRYLKLEHAERAVIFAAARALVDMRDATIYCTRFPCAACARAIVDVGIKRLVVGQGISAESPESPWIEEQRVAYAMLRDAGITLRYLSR
jgi:dCMP deaminase